MVRVARAKKNKQNELMSCEKLSTPINLDNGGSDAGIWQHALHLNLPMQLQLERLARRG